MKLSKIALAIAATATLAGVAHAGNFQSNATVVAREVIVSDAQQISSPQVSYTFAGPVGNPTNETYFQIQLKIDQGTWVVGNQAGFPVSSIDDTVTTPGDTGNVALVTQAGVVIATAWANYVDANDHTIIKATFKIPTGVNENNARVVFNSNGIVGSNANAVLFPGSQIHLAGLKTVVGDVVDCDNAIKTITGSIKQFPNISDPGYNATAADSTSASEDQRPGAQNSGPVASFPTNLRVSGTGSATIAVQDYAAQAKLFTVSPTSTTKTATLGTVRFDQQAAGYDADLVNVYGSLTPTTTFPTAALSNAGSVELKSFQAVVSGNFAANSKMWITPGACVDLDYTSAGAVSAVGGVATINYITAPFNKNVNYSLCYGVDGISVIPTSSFNAHLILSKVPDGLDASATTRYQEQNDSCNAQYTVGGGIRIDVRNYATFAKFGNSGPASAVRIINNSETATADIYAQMIYADGTYGAWGRLPDLAPRAVANYSNQQLESYMTKPAATTNPFGSAASNYEATGGSTVRGNTAAGVGDRVRIVSTTGSTLRVQSYIMTNNTVLNTSDAQGVDFEGLAALSNGRAPTTDQQPNSQDAINGLSRGGN